MYIAFTHSNWHFKEKGINAMFGVRQYKFKKIHCIVEKSQVDPAIGFQFEGSFDLLDIIR